MADTGPRDNLDRAVLLAQQAVSALEPWRQAGWPAPLHPDEHRLIDAYWDLVHAAETLAFVISQRDRVRIAV